MGNGEYIMTEFGREARHMKEPSRFSQSLEAKSKRKPTVKKRTVRTDEEVLEIFRQTVEKSKVTKLPTIITTDNPSRSKGKTGPRTTDGSGNAAKDQG